MKLCTKCLVEKPFELFSKSKGGKHGLKSECKDCSSIRYKNFYKENKEKLIEKTRLFRKLNPEYSKEQYVRYYSKNREKLILKSKIYAAGLSKDERSKKNRRYYLKHTYKIKLKHKIWNKNNLSKINFYSSNRRCRKRNATPCWLNPKQLEDIESFYILSSELNKVSSVKFSVDHIIPLSGEIVCGLHVPWNLQILTVQENCSKNNKF